MRLRMRFRSGQRSEALKRAWQGLNYRLQGVSLRQMLMKLSVPAQANISDCVDKGVLSLTAAGVQLVAQHRPWVCGRPCRPATRRRGGSGRAGRSDDGDDGACLRGGPRSGDCGPGGALMAAMSPLGGLASQPTTEPQRVTP